MQRQPIGEHQSPHCLPLNALLPGQQEGMRPTLLEHFKLGVDSFSENKERSPPFSLNILRPRSSASPYKMSLKKAFSRMNIRIQFQPVHWIPCSFLCFCLFFFHLRSTMVANGMCLVVLLILVFPCSSLEGRCLSPKQKTQPVMSDRRKAFTAGRKASCYSE